MNYAFFCTKKRRRPMMRGNGRKVIKKKGNSDHHLYPAPITGSNQDISVVLWCKSIGALVFSCFS